MKILLLKTIKQVVYLYKEHTPPEVKSSYRNKVVATICFNIDLLIMNLNKK